MTILLIVLLLLNIFLAFCGYYLASELEKKENDETAIKILENIESEIKIKRDKLDNNLNLLKECKMQGYSDSIGIIEKYISKLKGEKQMKTYLNKQVKITKPITNKVTCDVCGKTIADEKNRCAEYWTLVTHHNDWGNDSCESYENFDLCSKDCAQEKFNEYFDNCEDSNTREFELSQDFICIDIKELKGDTNGQ